MFIQLRYVMKTIRFSTGYHPMGREFTSNISSSVYMPYQREPVQQQKGKIKYHQ